MLSYLILILTNKYWCSKIWNYKPDNQSELRFPGGPFLSKSLDFFSNFGFFVVNINLVYQIPLSYFYNTMGSFGASEEFVNFIGTIKFWTPRRTPSITLCYENLYWFMPRITNSTFWLNLSVLIDLGVTLRVNSAKDPS